VSGSRAPVTVFAPGSVGNIGPGLDILGLAVAGRGDRVTAEQSGAGGVRIAVSGHPDLPAVAERHAAGIAAQEVLRCAGRSAVGVVLRVRKDLPLSGGQGGSAASAVAAAVAVNELLGRPLDRNALLEACLVAETAVAGRHADNLAPSLLGGAALVRSLDPLDVIGLPVPPSLLVVLAQPEQYLRTADSRRVLPATVPLGIALHQAAQVAGMTAAFLLGDLVLLGRALDDRIAEPARAALLPGFTEAKAAALAAGALGASISGSGPTAFALAGDRATAERVAEAMRAGYAARGVGAAVRVAEVDRQGARVVPNPAD
jgi:homoserine kinase